MRMIVGQSNFFFFFLNQHMSTALPLQFVILCDHFVYSPALQGHSKDICWSSKAMRLDKYHMWLMWILGNNCSWMRYLKWGESSWHFQSRKQNPLYVQHVFGEPWEACGNLVSNVQTTVILSTFPKIVQGYHIQSPACKAVRRRSMHSLPADTKQREREKKSTSHDKAAYHTWLYYHRTDETLWIYLHRFPPMRVLAQGTFLN